jgi:hypothetical protein
MRMPENTKFPSIGSLVIFTATAFLSFPFGLAAQDVRTLASIGYAEEDQNRASAAGPFRGLNPETGRSDFSRCVNPRASLPNNGGTFANLPQSDVPQQADDSNILSYQTGSTLSEFFRKTEQSLHVQGSYGNASGQLAYSLHQQEFLSQFSQFLHGSVRIVTAQRRYNDALELTNEIRNRFVTFRTENGRRIAQITNRAGFEEICGTHVIVGVTRGLKASILMRYESETKEMQSKLEESINTAYTTPSNQVSGNARYEQAIKTLQDSNSFEYRIIFRGKLDPSGITDIPTAISFLRSHSNAQANAANHVDLDLILLPYEAALPGIQFANPNSIQVQRLELPTQRLGSLSDYTSSLSYMFRQRRANGDSNQGPFQQNVFDGTAMSAKLNELRAEFAYYRAAINECRLGVDASCTKIAGWAKSYSHPVAPSRSLRALPGPTDMMQQVIVADNSQGTVIAQIGS